MFEGSYNPKTCFSLFMLHPHQKKQKTKRRKPNAMYAKLTFLVFYPCHKKLNIKKERTNCIIGEENVL